MSAPLPSKWAIRSFQCADPLPGFEAVAHFFEERRDKHGRAVFSLQCATAFGSTCSEATEKLTAFLQAEIARERKRHRNAEAFRERVRLRATRGD